MAKSKSTKKTNNQSLKPYSLELATSLAQATKSWLEKSLKAPISDGPKLRCLIVGATKKDQLPKTLQRELKPWQLTLFSQEQAVLSLTTDDGPLICYRLGLLKPVLTAGHMGQMEFSKRAMARDSAGYLFRLIESSLCQSLHIDFLSCSGEEIQGFLLGLDLSGYRFKNSYNQGERKSISLSLAKDGRKLTLENTLKAQALASSVNLARQLTNMPPNILHPEAYADWLEKYLGTEKNFKVQVWDEKRLVSEQLHLLLAVGRAASSQPRLVRISYRGHKSKKAIVLIGKGITFDSGGLDIKPSAGMRLMKKDMGGSASLVGFCHWLKMTKPPVNCEVYLALAENAIGAGAFRPGDVWPSRSGQMIEISNTDAEGRLVLADAFSVALEQNPTPQCVINLATLTGAIKASLGNEVAGLFSNEDGLSRKLLLSAKESGEYVWRMPLIQKYRASMKSNFADMTNSVEGFGGAVTAALFLESFVQKQPWAHFDIYAWSDAADGALLEAGGNGQLVQTLAEFVK